MWRRVVLGGQGGGESPGTLRRSLNIYLVDDTPTEDLPKSYEPEGVVAAWDSDTTVENGDVAQNTPEPEMKPEPENAPEPESKGENQPEKKPKKEKTEAQKMNHRRNSLNWHNKWLSKGVPRPPKVVSKTKSTKKKGSKDDKNKGNRAPATAAPAPATDGPGPALVSLCKAKEDFVTDWISKSTLPPSMERRNAAVKAWLESDVRANLMAQRAGVQK